MPGSDNLPPSQKYDFFSHGLATGSPDLFSPYLGPLANMPKHDQYANRSIAKWNMPDAYFDKNLYLQHTMEDLFLTAQWDFWTERIMPWYKTDQLSIQWTKWHANPHYMGVTPHQATSKVVTQGRTLGRASIIRRGIAAEFEVDFVTTPEGRTSFMASLAQMARSVQETANVEILRALLHCHRTQQDRHREYGVVQKHEFDTWLENKAHFFMISQKIHKGMELLNTQIDKEQELYGGTANVWILPREIHDHCDLAFDEKTLYMYAGQQGVDRLNGKTGGPQAAAGTMGNVKSLEPKRMVAGIPVFLAKAFHVDGIGHPELMSQITEIGVYNMMVDRTRDYTRYKTESRMLRVYNNDADRWADLELAAAIYNCGIWDDATGNLKDVFARDNQQKRLNELYDDENDFLSYPVEGGLRRNIDYVGDMAPSHLNPANLEAAGQTLLNALAYGDPTRMQSFMELFDRVRATGDLPVGAELATFTSIADRLYQLVGKDNLFFTGVGEGGYTATQALFENVVAGGNGERVMRDGLLDVDAQIGAPVAGAGAAPETKVQTFLHKVLGVAVPDTHKDKLQTIASDATVDWKQRGLAVKKLVTACKKEDASSVPALPDLPSIDTWYKNSVKDFENVLAKATPVAAAAAVTAKGAQESRYIPFGSPLPAGFRYANGGPAGSRDAAILSIPAFHTAIASAAEQQAAQGGGRSRVGVAGGRARLGARAEAAPGARGDMDEDRRLNEQYRQRIAGIQVRFTNITHHMRTIREGSSSFLLQVLAQVYSGTAFNRDRFLAYARANIAVLIGFLLMRPHATFKTLFGIKCADNGGAGYMFFGHGNMMIERTAAHKVGLMHYTAYLSAVVLEPRNVYVAENLFCQRYLGGMGISFWSPAEYKSSGANRRSRSIICAPLPPNFKTIEQKIDIRGRWYTDMHMNMITKERFNRPLYPGAGRINQLFGLRESGRTDVQATRARTPANYVCWQGMEWYRNATNGTWDDFTVESGNMGSSVYPGCGVIRNGHTEQLKDPGYTSVRH